MTHILVYLHDPERRDCDLGRLASIGDVQVTIASNLNEAKPALADAEILITVGTQLGDQAEAVLGGAPRLKYVQSIGTGTDNLRGHPAMSSDVAVCNVHGIHGAQLSEAAFAAMLSFSRGLAQSFSDQRATRWNKRAANLLCGKTVAIYGLGAIAAELAPRCAAFGMRVVGISATTREVPGFDKVYARADLARAVADVDYLILLTPLSSETYHSIDAHVLDAMKSSAVLINIARGGVVDEAALLAALQSGGIAGAALDVFETEPLPTDHPFWTMSNVMVTPHSAGFHTGYASDAYAVIEQNIRNYLSGGTAALINRVQ